MPASPNPMLVSSQAAEPSVSQPNHVPEAMTMTSQLVLARPAQAAWGSHSLKERLRWVRRFRHGLADNGNRLIESLALLPGRRDAVSMAAEVLPLADAARFLERRAPSILKRRRLSSSGRPLWLAGTRIETLREPHGVVLVIGPGNYPLMIPGIQALQALAAGNAVLWKPGLGGRHAALVFAEIAVATGLDSHLLQILHEPVEAVDSAIQAGVDKVILTGSSTTGRALLARLADELVPATMELSGCDAVFVRPEADLDLVVRALCFGVTLNEGATCIAPRRVFVDASRARELESKLRRAFAAEAPRDLQGGVAERLDALVSEAVSRGARIVTGQISSQAMSMPPLVLADVAPDMAIMRADIFAPVMSLCPVHSEREALEAAGACRFQLGATVFGDESLARAMARRVPAATVVVNDMIVPTADPRLPFSARGASGFGTTRGAEGLLDMTRPKAVVLSARRKRHLSPFAGGEGSFFSAFLRAAHSAHFAQRARAVRELITASRRLG